MVSTDGTPPLRRGMRSGIAAFTCSVVLIAWVVGLVYLASAASANDGAAVAASIMLFASWVLVPVLVVAMLVFAVIALLLNPVPGKILGALAIVAPVVTAVLFWNALGVTDLGQLG